MGAEVRGAAEKRTRSILWAGEFGMFDPHVPFRTRIKCVFSFLRTFGGLADVAARGLLYVGCSARCGRCVWVSEDDLTDTRRGVEIGLSRFHAGMCFVQKDVGCSYLGNHAGWSLWGVARPRVHPLSFRRHSLRWPFPPCGPRGIYGRPPSPLPKESDQWETCILEEQDICVCGIRIE